MEAWCRCSVDAVQVGHCLVAPSSSPRPPVTSPAPPLCTPAPSLAPRRSSEAGLCRGCAGDVQGMCRGGVGEVLAFHRQDWLVREESHNWARTGSGLPDGPDYAKPMTPLAAQVAHLCTRCACTCNRHMQRAHATRTCNMQHAHAPCDMHHAPCNMRMHRALCNMRMHRALFVSIYRRRISMGLAEGVRPSFRASSRRGASALPLRPSHYRYITVTLPL